MSNPTPTPTTRDALLSLGRDLDRLASSYKDTAARHALEALDGNEEEARKAKLNDGKSTAFKAAMQMVDAVRQRIDAGEIG